VFQTLPKERLSAEFPPFLAGQGAVSERPYAFNSNVLPQISGAADVSEPTAERVIKRDVRSC
jgi:hypothetical protein